VTFWSKQKKIALHREKLLTLKVDNEGDLEKIVDLLQLTADIE